MVGKQLDANGFSPELERSSWDDLPDPTPTKLKPLAVILNTPGKDAVIPGSMFSLSVAIGNQGRQSAIVDVSIDPVSPVLGQWCVSLQEHLALNSQQSDEVVFRFQVPNDALPGTYRYVVVVDAQEYYPEDTPMQFDQQMQVLPPTQDLVRTSDPTFILQPITSSANPAVIQLGGALPVQVMVHNRADRVDRFRLVCTDLPKNWYTVTYPQGVQGLGIVVDADSLNLNPGDRGLISLQIHPPLDALAGNYVPTLRLHSENYPNLTLLDLVYLQVPPIYLLQSELRTLLNRIRKQAGVFQVRLSNAGNTNRELRLHVKNLDEEDLCTYKLEHSQVRVLPKQIVGIDLQVQPKHWWQRPLYGGRVLNFSVDLEDTQQLPLPLDNLPGVLVWEARPWWQFLPLLALGLLGVAAIAYLLWWLLFRIPPSPKIVQFYPEDNAYAAANADTVRLGWQISDPQRLQAIKIVGLSADGTPLTRPDVYDFSQGLPAILQPFCSQQAKLLSCHNVRTGARKPTTYTFEMTVQPRQGRGMVSEIGKTSPVKIEPIPQPQIVSFASTKPMYQEIDSLPASTQAATSPIKVKASDFGIRLNWAIANPDRLQALRAIGRTPNGLAASPMQQYDFSKGIPSELQKVCQLGEQLVCQNVKTAVNQPGTYIFELTAIPQDAVGTPIETKKTDTIEIAPKPPRILEFKLNGRAALPQYLIPVSKGQLVPKLNLSWLVDASKGTKVELMPAPGSVSLKGNIPLVLSPPPGNVTVMLQVTAATGQQVTRSVKLETYDPTATDPAAAAAAAAAAAIANAQKPEGSAGLPSTTPASPDSLAPIELPPQFDKR